jgi:anaphase-promoting complex subunit 6
MSRRQTRTPPYQISYDLAGNLDIMASKAQCHLSQRDSVKAIELTDAIRAIDPYQEECLTSHIVALVELKRCSDLFHYAHELVESAPESALSWFAVGCYYFIIKKFDQAQRYHAHHFHDWVQGTVFRH